MFPRRLGGFGGLLVEKIFAAHSIERRKVFGPGVDYLFWRRTGLERADGFRIAKQQEGFADVEILGVFFLEDGGNLQTDTHGAKRIVIGDTNANATTTASSVKPADRNKGL